MVSTHLKNVSQNGNLPQIGVKIKNLWNHHLENHRSYIYAFIKSVNRLHITPWLSLHVRLKRPLTFLLGRHRTCRKAISIADATDILGSKRRWFKKMKRLPSRSERKGHWDTWKMWKFPYGKDRGYLSRELTYPTLGKGNHLQNASFGG